ncbi:hypothetical protein [Microbulbifer rhizosphaerae]|uniref:Uncharacterized protein n=1 Tax=Microbulbifer rhizosphaerae TaxID=1562603 RepID=A0A7W4ZAR5_9GAMM|nr:hypothetical protein [Microbulbifer rhizosphaerae]MBB3062831.1 hypothetical protein [Microbulbifer rhizosphaerae]
MAAISIRYEATPIAANGRSYKVRAELRRCNLFGTVFLATAVAISNYFARMGLRSGIWSATNNKNRE